MSITSALIIRRTALPTAAELTSAIADTGATIVFPAGFRLDHTPDGWVTLTVDGEETGFDFTIQPLHELAPEDLPAGAAEWGDTLLSFSARGSLSAQAVTLIQDVLGRRWRAALLIEDELVPPDELARSVEPAEGMDPDLLATMRGSPAERAAAVDRYVARYYPPAPGKRRAAAMNVLQPLFIPLAVLALLGALYIWTLLA